MLSLHISDPQFLPETDSDFVFVGPLIASIYLGSALAFALYSMISHPDLYERVQAEADALFGDGYPAKDDFKENFPDPLKFDIDRYLPGREEHKKRGAYAPFGLGTHTCLGSRWVDFQMVVNVLLITYHFRLDLYPANYQLGFNPFPTSSPNKKLKFVVVERRHEF